MVRPGPSPLALVLRQMARDRAATRRVPSMLDHKRQRMIGSAHALFRGTAPLFYELLRDRPWLLPKLPGEGWNVGDMHLENVGAYRTDGGRVVFDLNDFDDAAEGPWALDVLRLGTSAFLAGRSFGADGPTLVGLVEALLEAYARAAFSGRARKAPTPAPIADLLTLVETRSKAAMLDARAPKLKGHRRFTLGTHFLGLPASVRREVPGLLATYRTVLGPRCPATAWTIEDASQRVAGTGSLGIVRVALMVSGDAGHERLLDLKQARPPAVAALVPQPRRDDAERMVAAARRHGDEAHAEVGVGLRGRDAIQLGERELRDTAEPHGGKRTDVGGGGRLQW